MIQAYAFIDNYNNEKRSAFPEPGRAPPFNTPFLIPLSFTGRGKAPPLHLLPAERQLFQDLFVEPIAFNYHTCIMEQDAGQETKGHIA